MNIFTNNSDDEKIVDPGKELRFRSRVFPSIVLAIILLQGTFIYIFDREQQQKITESKQITAQRVRDSIENELDTRNGKIETVPEAIIPDPALISKNIVGNAATTWQRDRLSFDRLKSQLKVLNVDLILTLDKHFLDRQEWEQKNQKLGRKLAWNDFPNFAIVEKTTQDISQPLAQAILQSQSNLTSDLTISNERQTIQVILIPLIDADGLNLGSVVVFNDISDIVRASRQSVLTVSAIAILLGTGSIITLYVFFGKIDHNLNQKTLKLTEAQSEEVKPEYLPQTADPVSEVKQELATEKSENLKDILKNKIQMPERHEKPSSVAVKFEKPVNSGKLREEETTANISQDKVKIQLSEKFDNLETKTEEVPSLTIVGYQGKKKTVLVVDDEWINRSLIVDLLEPIGFIVIEASNGEKGLEQANIYNPDLIITDLMMPVMTGFQFIKHLRESYECRKVPILASSASQFGTELYKSIDAGATAFLNKPVDAETLMQQLEKYLQLEWIYGSNDGEND
jgi:CheY-like chemotaxis protein